VRHEVALGGREGAAIATTTTIGVVVVAVAEVGEGCGRALFVAQQAFGQVLLGNLLDFVFGKGLQIINYMLYKY
jgi:hypothetical protein